MRSKRYDASKEELEGYVGKSIRAKEARAPLIGKAKYTNDYTFSGQLYAHILRSPHAAAKINSVDVSGAKRSPVYIWLFAGRMFLSIPMVLLII